MGAFVYFLFTGNDSGLPDEANNRLNGRTTPGYHLNAGDPKMHNRIDKNGAEKEKMRTNDYTNMKYLFALMILIGFGACRNRSMEFISNSEKFEIFYSKFNEDINFQNSRIKYPLKGKMYSEENQNPNSDYEWTLKDHLDFDIPKLDTSVYKVRRTYEEDLVKESVYIEASSFMLDYTFKLDNGKWYLIYYSDRSED